MNILRALLDRFDEPSSWAAIAALLTGLGVNMPEALWQSIVFVGAGLAGLAGFFIKEKNKDEEKKDV